MSKEIERFACQGDDGKSYVVVVVQRFLPAGTGDPRRNMPSRVSAQLRDGSPLNKIDSRTFQDPESGVVLRRVED